MISFIESGFLGGTATQLFFRQKKEWFFFGGGQQNRVHFCAYTEPDRMGMKSAYQVPLKQGKFPEGRSHSLSLQPEGKLF